MTSLSARLAASSACCDHSPHRLSSSRTSSSTFVSTSITAQSRRCSAHVPRVSARMSSVLMRSVARPRSFANAVVGRVARVLAGRSTTSPFSNRSKVTELPAFRPRYSRTGLGMVTCPLLVRVVGMWYYRLCSGITVNDSAVGLQRKDDGARKSDPSRLHTHERRIAADCADGGRVRAAVALQNSDDLGGHLVRARDQESPRGLRIAQQRLIRALQLRRQPHLRRIRSPV